MSGKKDLTAKLVEEPTKPKLTRGAGMRLSTDASAKDAQAHNRTSAKAHTGEVKRVRRGYALREDLVKACKRIALEEDRHLYEVMEEALGAFVRSHTNASISG